LDANANFFACMPQSDDALLHDEAIRVSVHDRVHASRLAPCMHHPFAHMKCVRGMLHSGLSGTGG
jgi:7-keto-8-aminopelargonate synthetase-like enzyme